MIEIGSTNTNLSLGSLESIEARSRPRAQAPSAGADVAEVSMNFDDLVDMLNPLQHIPVLSSVYRATTGEDIHPVSRIAGAALYGGIMGLASAGIGALTALVDEAIAPINDGQTASKTIITALFDTEPPSAQTRVAANSPDQTGVEPPPTAPETHSLTLPPAPAAAFNAFAPPAEKALEAEKPPKLAAASTPLPQSDNNSHNKALASSLAVQRENIQAQKAPLNNRFVTAIPPAKAGADQQTDYASRAEPETRAALDLLLRELQAMRGTSQYQSTAQTPPLNGTMLNILN